MNLLYPCLAQIGWTFVVAVKLLLARRAALISGAVTFRDIAVSSEAWPEKARLAAANFANQFETPVLFYALTLLALHLGAGNPWMVFFAWVYVASRIAHTLVHTGSNKVMRRFQCFAIGVVALLAMLLGIMASQF